MEHRIRSAAIIIDERNRLLLLKNKNSQTGEVFYIPPGGGLDEGEDIFINAKRETKEETGLEIETERIIYLREYLDSVHNSHNLEVYILAGSFKGELSVDHPHADGCIEDVCWFTREDLQDKKLYPNILKDEFWEDLKNNFPQIKYLGQEKD